MKQIVKRAVYDTRIKPVAQNNATFQCACMNDHTKTAKYIMSLAETYPKINSVARNNTEFVYACHYGHKDTIRYLLSVYNVRKAVRNGRIDHYQKSYKSGFRHM